MYIYQSNKHLLLILLLLI